MKKKFRSRAGKRLRPRNAPGGVTVTASRPRSRSFSRAAPPEWKTIVAAVAGGAGSAALGGLIWNQQILSPETVGIGLMLGGGATAYFSEGITRVVGTSVAASGAGQFALAVMNKRAVRAHENANRTRTDATTAVAGGPPAPQLAPPPAVRPRQHTDGGGVVVDLFRDAANDLDALEDEWRYGIRDESQPAANVPVVIDLDDAA